MPQESPAFPKPDAVLIPRSYPVGSKNEVARHQQLNKIFGPVFGTPRVATAGVLGQEQSFVRPYGPDQEKNAEYLTTNTMYFPQDHRLATNERYHWYVARQDSAGAWTVIGPVTGQPEDLGEVRFGYAVDEESLIQATAPAAADSEYERALAAQVNDPAVRARMERSGLLPKGATPKAKDDAPANVAKKA